MKSMKKTARSFLVGLMSALPVLGGAWMLSQPGVAYADDDDEVIDDSAPIDTTVEGGYEDTDPSAVTAFQSDLAPYGAWVVDDTYGTVWVPDGTLVGAEFAPYQTAGHWALTDDGEWLWVSDYSWGYIPFHYGRWVWISGRGWSWIPGRAYAPSWVVWRTGAYGYIGWAPMPPAYYWDDGVYVVLAAPPPAAFVFCGTDDVFAADVHSHIVRDRASVRRAADGTRPYVLPGGRHYGPSYPTVGEAHYSGAAPKPSAANPKAIAMARPQYKATSGGGAGLTSSGSSVKTISNVARPASGNTARAPATRGESATTADPWARPGAATNGPSRGTSSPAPVRRELRPEPRPVTRRIESPRPQPAPVRSVSRPQPEPAPAATPRPAPAPAPAPRPASPAPRAAPAPQAAPAPVHHSSSAPSGGRAGGSHHR